MDNNWFDRVSAGRESKTLLSVVKFMQRLGQCSHQSLQHLIKHNHKKMLKACPSNQGRRHNFLIGQISCFLFSGLVWQCWINHGALSWAITLEYWKGLERILFFEGSELGIIGRLFSIRLPLVYPRTRPSKTRSCR